MNRETCALRALLAAAAAACLIVPAAGRAASAAPAASAPVGSPPASQAAPPPLLVADGATVVQAASRLVWSRCVEGMRWDGRTCVGRPQRVDLAGAQQLAAARRRADGLGWRLPRVPELQRLGSFARRQPAQARQLFPVAPGDPLWSATARVDSADVNPYNYGNIAAGRSAGAAQQEAALFGWAVQPFTGEAVGDVPRATRLPVRLVRAAD